MNLDLSATGSIIVKLALLGLLLVIIDRAADKLVGASFLKGT